MPMLAKRGAPMRENANDQVPESAEDQARREFLIKAGRFAALTQPTITVLLGTSMNSSAVARSGGGGGGLNPAGHVSQGRGQGIVAPNPGGSGPGSSGRGATSAPGLSPGNPGQGVGQVGTLKGQGPKVP